MSELLWDKGNRKHATRHGVSRKEIEEVFRRPYALDVREPQEGEDEIQLRAYGTTAQGPYVTSLLPSAKDGFARSLPGT